MNYHEDKYAEKYEVLSQDVKTQLEKELPRKERYQHKDITWVSSLSKIVEEADKLAKEYSKSIEDVRIEYSYHEDYGSISVYAYLTVKGLETDKQYHARLGEHHERLQYNEERERQEFQRLSKKFTK